MSSTNRSGESYKQRMNISDYYATPINKIEEFLEALYDVEPTAFNGIILDPCAGGDENKPMSYPEAIKNKFNLHNVKSIDIREDSLSEVKGNYLEMELDYKPRMIITNPPFLLAREIIDKALEDVEEYGYVIMLLRLNFFGGKKRKDLFDKHMPKHTFVHNRRMSFTDDKKTDSIEYAHFVWQKGYEPDFTQLRVIS